MPISHPVLSMKDVSLSFDDRNIFKDVDLNIDSGESVAILGPSGAGKSSLLSIALGLMRPNSGKVSIDNQSITRASSKFVTKLRGEKIGMVFQFGELIPELSPAENVALPAILNCDHVSENIYSDAKAALERFGIDPNTDTVNLSGGERQRVAVARALFNRPRLLLADEPTGALDEETRDRIADTIFQVPNEYNCGLLIVTHDYSIAERADRTLRIQSHDLVIAKACS